jgi:hypothetical protein
MPSGLLIRTLPKSKSLAVMDFICFASVLGFIRGQFSGYSLRISFLRQILRGKDYGH